MIPSWDGLVALLDLPVADSTVVGVVARAGSAVEIRRSSIQLRPHGVWFSIFRDTVRSVSLTLTKSPDLGRWTGPVPAGIPRTSDEDELEMPPRAGAIVRA